MVFKLKATVLAAGILLVLPIAGKATTCNSVAACVLGNNTGTGVGLEGVSQTNVALYGVSTSNHGIDGRSRQSYGVVGYTYANGSTSTTARAGVFGIDSGSGSNNSGVVGTSVNGYGVFGVGALGVVGVGSAYGGVFENNTATTPSLVAFNAGGGLVFEADNANGALASIDGAGNAIFAGSVTYNGSPLIRTRTTSSDITSYGARTSSPTLEDFGTGQLRNGEAFVTLDRTFVSAIDARSYMVFVTPHGDSNSLYTVVAPSGFTVRESKGGRSTLAFDYRIVAKPLDSKSARLPELAAMRRTTRFNIPSPAAFAQRR